MAETGAISGNAIEHNSNLPPEMEVNLNDDKAAQNGDFVGATLELGSRGPPAQEDVEFKGVGINRDRPYSASMASRKSTTSTKSRTSLSPNIHVTPFSTGQLFSYKGGTFEKAIEVIQQELVKPDIDGQIHGAWLLTEIDHWDHEKEKVVVLTENSLLVVKYDFIATKLGEFRRIMLHIIDTLQIGDLVYPEKSIMPPREHGGIKLSWDKGQGTTFGQRWNPWASNIPYIILAHHPLMYTEKEKETITYNVDDFYDSLVQNTLNAFKRKTPNQTITPVEAPIMIESYASVSSLIFNQSHLGYNRERGGVSF